MRPDLEARARELDFLLDGLEPERRAGAILAFAREVAEEAYQRGFAHGVKGGFRGASVVVQSYPACNSDEVPHD